MKSLMAVAAQMILSASNYLIFMLLAKLLPSGEFVAFSTTVGLNMLAYALAEGGVSYVAPRELADRGDRQGAALAGAFIAISTLLYLVAMVGGFFLWNGLSRDPLSMPWVLAYAMYFAPALLIPSWVTCWSVDLPAILGLGAVRLTMVVIVCIARTPLALAASGVLFLGAVVILIRHLNRDAAVVGWFDRKALRRAVAGIRQVFAAKTMSYAVYGVVPLVVGTTKGNAIASVYVFGERFKSLYATLFQPIIQTVYLWQFQATQNLRRKRLAEWGLNLTNGLGCIVLLWGTQMGLLAVFGERFSSQPDMPWYIAGAGASVATASMLYLRVFPAGAFDVFGRASVAQMIAFVGLLTALGLTNWMTPGLILALAEGTLLVAVASQLVVRRARTQPQVLAASTEAPHENLADHRR